MEILMVTAELAPYSGTGAAGHTVAQLAGALTELGHGVTVAMPRLTGLEESGMMVARRLTPLKLPGGEEVTVFDGQLPSGVRLALFDSENLESRASGYGEGGKDYPDLALRFGTLCRSAAALAAQRAAKGKGFDVVHAQDWAAAAMPVCCRLPCLLSVHDAARQGNLALKDLDAFGIPEDKALRERYKLGSRANALKGGMLSAQLVCTESPTYAAQLIDVELSGAFGASLADAGVVVQGVCGGIDYAVNNPGTDTALAVRYDAAATARKGGCKTAVLRELGIELDPERPLVVFAGELDKSTGADLVVGALPELLREQLDLIVVGAGGKALSKQLGAARLKRLPNYRFIESALAADRRRVVAAADIALCPTRIPISGEAARLAQRYGTVPVALSTPVVRDSVVDCAQDLKTGTGFLFTEPSSEALVGATQRALSATVSPAWGRLRRRVMRLDLGWERAARRYAQLYRMITARAA